MQIYFLKKQTLGFQPKATFQNTDLPPLGEKEKQEGWDRLGGDGGGVGFSPPHCWLKLSLESECFLCYSWNGKNNSSPPPVFFLKEEGSPA